MKKIKILHIAETSGAVTGFGNYTRELMTRLANNKRFELAELASYSTIEDDKDRHAIGKWKVYPNAVHASHPEYNEYVSRQQNKYGEWRFERVLLDFQPDICFSVRDPWMMSFEAISPLRKFYHWVVSPTVDSSPQQTSWIDMFKSADGVLTYSKFGMDTLRKQCSDIKLHKIAYPGINHNIFKPLNTKSQIRNMLGIPQDAIIIGSVMRNQRRKLLPELCRFFRLYLDKYGHTTVGKNTYLYLHTSYPDMGWDLPKLLKDYGISNKVLFTYVCGHSGSPSCSLFEGAKTYSHVSNSITSHLPNVSDGLVQEQLAQIYNTFDLYLQYSSCEGSGFTLLEAASCGIPVAALNYSAVEDTLRLTNGLQLKYHSFCEWETKAFRAHPNCEENIKIVYNYLSRDEEYRNTKSKQARKAILKHFDWDKNTKIWSDYFESIELTGLQGQWKSQQQPINPNIPSKIPDNLSNIQFIQWLFTKVLQQPELFYRYDGLMALQQLNLGTKIVGMKTEQVTRQSLLEHFTHLQQNIINCEQARITTDSLIKQDYIEYANLQEIT